jgi:hypothetical protein
MYPPKGGAQSPEEYNRARKPAAASLLMPKRSTINKGMNEDMEKATAPVNVLNMMNGAKLCR